MTQELNITASWLDREGDFPPGIRPLVRAAYMEGASKALAILTQAMVQHPELSAMALVKFIMNDLIFEHALQRAQRPAAREGQ